MRENEHKLFVKANALSPETGQKEEFGKEHAMNYLTVREAAQKWSVSQRLVQRYCAQGRIDGAKKLGTSWLIPAGAPKPDDPRKEREGQALEASEGKPGGALMPLLNTPFQPGQCRAAID